MIEVCVKEELERKMTAEDVMNIMSLVVLVNGLEKRDSDYGRPNYKQKYPTVFARFLGHIAVLEIDIHVNGWIPKRGPDNDFSFRLDENFDKKQYDEFSHYMESLIEWMEKDSEQKTPLQPTKAM